jgi:hypothetical protein
MTTASVSPITETDIGTELRQDVAAYVAPIKTFLVIDDATMQRAGDTIKEIDRRIKVVDEKFSDSYEAAMETKRKAEVTRKTLVTLIEEIKAPLVEVKTSLQKQGKDYQKLVDKRQEEERVRLAAIARKEAEDRAIEEAAALEAEGKTEEAAQVIDEPVYVPPPIVAKPAYKVDGRSFQKRWKGRGVNKMEAIKAIAANPAYQHLLTFDDVAINNMARSIRGACPVKGIEFYEE